MVLYIRSIVSFLKLYCYYRLRDNIPNSSSSGFSMNCAVYEHYTIIEQEHIYIHYSVLDCYVFYIDIHHHILYAMISRSIRVFSCMAKCDIMMGIYNMFTEMQRHIVQHAAHHIVLKYNKCWVRQRSLLRSIKKLEINLRVLFCTHTLCTTPPGRSQNFEGVLIGTANYYINVQKNVWFRSF